MIRILVVGVVLQAAAVWAQAAVQVAPMPVEFKRPPPGLKSSERDEVNSAIRRALRTYGGTPVMTATLEKVAGELKRQDCAIADDCVATFATRCEALYGLHVVVDVSVSGEILATGRVVRDDGQQARAPKTAKVPGSKLVTFQVLAKQAVEQLIVQLDIGALPTVRAKTVEAPPVVVDAGVPAVAVVPAPEPVDAGVSWVPPPPPPLEPSPLKTVGLVTTIAGSAAAVGGLTMFFIGRGQAGTLLNPDGTARAGLSAEQAAQVRTAGTLQGAGVGVGAAGVAAVAAGLTMLVLAPTEQNTTTVWWAPMPGGAAMVLTGAFP